MIFHVNRSSHFFFHEATASSGPGPPHYRGFTITLRHSTFGRTPLDEGPASRRHLHLTTHNTHKRQTSMPPAKFEPAIPASERPKTHALDRAANGIGTGLKYVCFFPAEHQWDLADSNCLQGAAGFRARCRQQNRVHPSGLRCWVSVRHPLFLKHDNFISTRLE